MIVAHFGWMRRVARKLVGRAAADDLVQDAVVLALANGADRQPDKLFKAHTRRILRNRSIDVRRRAATENRLIAFAAPGPFPRAEECPEGAALNKEVRIAVGKLPEAARVALKKDADDGHIDEVVDELGVTEHAAWHRVHRSRAMLAQTIENDRGIFAPGAGLPALPHELGLFTRLFRFVGATVARWFGKKPAASAPELEEVAPTERRP